MEATCGYKSALAKARDAARAADPKAKAKAKASPRKTVNSIVSSDDDHDDTASASDWSDECPGHVDAVRRFRPVANGTSMTRTNIPSPSARPINAVNRFSGLEKPQVYDLPALNQWAHRVKVVQQIGRKTKSKPMDKKLEHTVNYISGSKTPDADTLVVLKSSTDVDALSGLMAPLPTDKRGMAKAVRKLDSVHLEADER